MGGVARYVNLSFVGVGLLSWIVLGGLMAWFLGLFGASWNAPLLGVNFRVADLLGMLGAIVAVIYLRRRYGAWALEVGNELARVTWPTFQETKLATIVVIITTIIISLILGVFDYIWAWLTSLIYGY